MSQKLAARLVAVDFIKIADLQENDTTAHDLDVSAIVPSECMAMIVLVERSSGSGYFHIYPRGHATENFAIATNQRATIIIKNQTIKWRNTVANDDWDLSLLAYFTQRRTR